MNYKFNQYGNFKITLFKIIPAKLYACFSHHFSKMIFEENVFIFSLKMIIYYFRMICQWFFVLFFFSKQFVAKRCSEICSCNFLVTIKLFIIINKFYIHIIIEEFEYFFVIREFDSWILKKVIAGRIKPAFFMSNFSFYYVLVCNSVV